MVEDEIVGRVLGGADLLHDHVLLARELVGVEGRIGEDVGEHVERERHVGLEHARVIGGGLDAGRGIEVAADRLDLLGDLARGAPRRALERHVLEQMRDAVLVGPLVAAAGADPDAERGGFQMRHRVGDDGKARGEARDFDAHAAAPSRAARLAARMRCSTAAWSGRQHGDALRPRRQIGKPIRQRRAHAAGRLDGVGKLGRMRGRQHDHRHRRVAAFPSRRPPARRRCADRCSSRSRAARCGWWRRSPPRRRGRR